MAEQPRRLGQRDERAGRKDRAQRDACRCRKKLKERKGKESLMESQSSRLAGCPRIRRGKYRGVVCFFLVGAAAAAAGKRRDDGRRRGENRVKGQRRQTRGGGGGAREGEGVVDIETVDER